MKYYGLSFLLLIIPFTIIYLNQIGVYKREGREWATWNKLGVYVAFSFFLFIVIAPNIFPKFYQLVEIGWRVGRRDRYPGEVFYFLYWLVGLMLVAFPKVAEGTATSPWAIARGSIKPRITYIPQALGSALVLGLIYGTIKQCL